MTKNLSSLKQLAHGAGFSFIFGIIGFVLMFVFRMFAARQLGPTNLGFYDLTITVFSILFVFSTLGIPEGITRHIPLYEEQKKFSLLKGYLRFIFTVPLLISLLVASLVLIFAPFLVSLFNWSPDLVLALRLVSLTLPLKSLSNVLRFILISKEKILYSVISYNLIEKLTLLAGLFFVLLFKLNVIFLVGTFCFSLFFGFLFDLFQFKKRIFFSSSRKIKFHSKDWFKFSIPLLFSGIFAFFINWSDNLVIGSILDLSSLGIYAAAYSLSSFLLFFKTSFSSVFTPIITKKRALGDSKGVSFFFTKSQSWIFGFSLPVFLIFVFFSRKLLSFIYGPDFQEGYLSLIILLFGFMVSIFLGLNQNILLVHKKTPYLFKITVIVALLNIFFNILLVPLWGIIGAAISSSVALSLQSFLIFLKSRKLETLKFPIFMNFKFFIASILSLLIASIPYFLFSQNIYVMVALMALIFIFSFTLLVFVLKLIDSDDVALILSLEKYLGLNLSWLKKNLKRFFF